MDKSDKLTDMVYEEKDVRKSVEKRKDFPDNVEIVENAQTVMHSGLLYGTVKLEGTSR